jgi:hypothetical protein
MHKLRRAMVRPDRELLGGDGVSVEADQTFLGGRSTTRSGARSDNKSEVIIAVERQHPKGFGRVRLAHIETSNRKYDLLDFVQHTIAHGTILYTDGDPSYAVTTQKLQITHVPIAMVHSPNPAHVELPGVHLVASLLKRWPARCTAANRTSTSSTTSTSSPSGSTDAPADHAGCSGTASFSKRSTPTLTHSLSSHTKCNCHWS